MAARALQRPKANLDERTVQFATVDTLSTSISTGVRVTGKPREKASERWSKAPSGPGRPPVVTDCETPVWPFSLTNTQETNLSILEVHNPLYLSLQPSNKHLAEGLVSLLTVNFWFRLTMITQEELRHDGFHRTFRELTEDGKWTIEDEVFVSKGASQATLNATMAMISGNTSKIFVLHATTSLTRNIFLTARNILPRENRFAWIITENAYTRNEELLQDFPLGTKAFLVNHDVRSEELFRDTLDLIAEAITAIGDHEEENVKGAAITDAPAQHSLIHSRSYVSPSYTFPSSSSTPYKTSIFRETSSSISPSSLSHSLTPRPRRRREKPEVRDCWSNRADVQPPHHNTVY
ncbi:glutamate [NMDA] receptor subunit epsilon2like [Acyrthosiphon pisum], partial [Elysia marginata]